MSAVYAGARPEHAGDLAVAEAAGIAPVPAADRYAPARRTFFPWFAGNLEMSTLFLGTLPIVLGLGFWWGLAALLTGMIIGAVPVAVLGTRGPKTGTAQLAQARAAFGRTIAIPGLVQVLSAIGWIAIVALFGVQAVHQLGLPFWAGSLIVVGVIAAIVIRGYELQAQILHAGSAVMVALFAVITVQLFRHHVTLPPGSLHGAALAGTFVLMVAIALSGPFSWLPYASDYSRPVRPDASPAWVFGYQMAGMCASCIGVSVIGLAAASVIGGNQTVNGIWRLMGGGGYGTVAMLAITFAAIVSSSLNGYSTTLSAQAAGIKISRIRLAWAVSLLALAGVWWLNSGNLAGHFTNLLLFTSYWCSPFLAVVLLDWRYHRLAHGGRGYSDTDMRALLDWRKLPPGWDALAAFLIGFGAMVPFMDTSVIEGTAASALAGADLAFPVGFIVTLAAYALLRRYAPGAAQSAARRRPAAAAGARTG